MPLPPTAFPPQNEGNLKTFDKIRLISFVVLAALLIVCLGFSWATRGAMSNMPFLSRKGAKNIQKSIVDLRPWQTAQTLAALAVTAEEGEFARDAERLADHEVDQAFATALRQANLNAEHPKLTGGAIALSQRVKELQDVVAQDHAEVQRLTALSASHKGSEEDSSDDDLDIAKAQLGLDTDQLNDAQDDLNRATGDNRAQIQSELNAHEATMAKYDSETKNGGEIAVISVTRQGTLAGRLRGWSKQLSRTQLIQQAIQETNNDLNRLTTEHNALETQVNAAAVRANSTTATDYASRLAELKSRGAERQILSIYDDRIQTELQLVRIYDRWAAQLTLQRQILLHLIFRSLALIVFILICMILAAALVRRFLAVPAASQRQMHTLRTVLDLSIQVFGILLILLIIFGWPQQTPTILGLVTAGITIVLQDFILAFFGWFVLMGKNGMRVGDRVEINGVSGEVTEIGLMNTTLIEIGSNTDTGLPTGRRISFINSFAIRGKYFNYSTTGQWMWDELKVTLPATSDPRPIVDRIKKVVEEETSEGAGIALKEWKRSMHSGYLGRNDTTYVVSLIPSAGDYEIQIRYVTRASQRFETRTALYRRVFDSIHEGGMVQDGGPQPEVAEG